MIKCWDNDPTNRPQFSDLKARLAAILVDHFQEKYVQENHCYAVLTLAHIYVSRNEDYTWS